MNLCVFSPDLPYPPNRGGRADVWRRILGLRALGHQVMLVCLVEPAGHPLAPSAAELAAVDAVVAARFSFPMRRNPWRMLRQVALAWHTPWHAATRVPLHAEQQRLQAMLDDFAPDVLWLDGPWFGRLVLDVLACGCKARLAYRSHNIEHEYLWRQAAVALRLRDRLAWRMACWGLARFERKLMDRADVVFDISMDDLSFWQARGVQHLHWLPPLPELAVADGLSNPAAGAAPAVPGEVVFVGNLSTPNNVRGVQFLLCDVLPLLRARRPGTSVSVVGSRPGADVRAWAARAGAVLHADVAQPMQHMLGAAVLVNPVMTGGGVQVKILDMLMTDRPIVTTTQGTRGLPVEVTALLRVADTAAEFAEAVCAALDQAQAQASADVAERARVRQQFSVAALGAALQRLPQAAPGRQLTAPRLEVR
jgi:glycosyltransferase involved in cell wall biosynthesis